MTCAQWSRREILGAAALAGVPRLSAAAGKLRAGAAAVNITPLLGSSMAGGMTDRRATDVHDDLLVRALVLENGDTRLGLAIVDSCAVPRSVIDAAKAILLERSGIPAANVLIAATHTHTAPPAAHLFQSQPDSQYTEWLTRRIADAVLMASARLQPARIAWGVGREERLVFNRRYYMKPGTIPPNPFGEVDQVQMNPPAGSPDIVRAAGPTDPAVGVLAVESLDGNPIAVVGNYALHYVGGTAAGQISADYFGVWSGAMNRLAGRSPGAGFPPFVASLTNACSGNINGINFLHKSAPMRPYEQMQRYAEILAAEAYRTLRTLEFQDSVELSASIEEVELGVRRPNADQLAAARRVLAAAPPPPPLGYTDRAQLYAREAVLLDRDYPPSVRTPVQALRIGGLGIATFPGEAFVELGLEVKARSPFKTTFLIELANDYRGYIPTVAGHELGGYETWRAKSSYLEKEAAPKLVAAALRRLGALAG